MPSFYKKNLLSEPIPSSEELLPSPLDTPELEAPDRAFSQPTSIAPTPRVSYHEVPQFDDDPVRTLISWYAPARPFRKKERSYYTTIAILAILISLILLLAGEKMLIAAVFALVFLVYVLAYNPPPDIEYKLSTQGVTIADHFYHWQELDSFYFTEKDGSVLLHIYTQLRFPIILMLVLKDAEQQEEVKKIVAKYLPFHEIAPKTWVDKWSEGLQKHFPLENPHH